MRSWRPIAMAPLCVALLAAALRAATGLEAEGDACTSLLVTPGASSDGSTMITYTCDGVGVSSLRRTPAADHEPGTFVEGMAGGEVPQVPHTFAVVGLVNEHQLAIGETTFGGRPELVNREGGLHYWHLMQLALQRARTAREAIAVMTGLVAEHGYRSSGESFSIGDTREAWILEMIGPGPGGQGAHWVAVRVPDGHISAHANRARIGEIPPQHPDRCLRSENVVSFAVEQGFWDPDSGQPFRFCEVYCPPTPVSLRISEARVWSLFRRAAPSLELSADYHRGLPGAERYPLTVAPERKLSVADVFALMRDHYEGTGIDMTRGLAAGPFGSPHRVRPLTWEVDGEEQCWERPISTHHTIFSFVSQSRAWLPDPVGGVMWYSPEDTDFACYTPFYCCIDALPESYTLAERGRFDWDSAWWTFSFVANYSNLMYSRMIEDVRAVQSEIEGNYLALQPAVEETAAALVERDPELAVRYLTDYSVSHAELLVSRWRELGEYLLGKYNDGYVEGREVGYPQDWLRRVLEDRAGQHRLPPR